MSCSGRLWGGLKCRRRCGLMGGLDEVREMKMISRQMRDVSYGRAVMSHCPRWGAFDSTVVLHS